MLVPGQNIPLTGEQCAWTIECDEKTIFGEYAGLALLPVNEKRQPKGEPALLQLGRDWMEWRGEREKIACALHLAKLPAGADRLLLIVYIFSAAGPINKLANLRLQINGQIDFHLNLAENGEGGMIIGEFYSRNQQWKFRALAEGMAYGLAAFGRRIGLNIDDAHPHRRAGGSDRSRASSCTGTGFAVDDKHILTCAHVIEDMREIHIASFTGRHRAEPVVADSANDLALLRVQVEPGGKPVLFKEGAGCHLGDSVVVLGFPLAGLAGSGVHVTQGGVSSLFGLHNDASLLQFTAPIQPGSSGSPVFNETGMVVGMVTSTIIDAQNMNFAVKTGIILAFLEACGLTVAKATRDKEKKTFTTAEMAREAQPSLWRIEANS